MQLTPGHHEVKRVAIAEDMGLARGTVSFTVAAAPPTPPPTASPKCPNSG